MWVCILMSFIAFLYRQYLFLEVMLFCPPLKGFAVIRETNKNITKNCTKIQQLNETFRESQYLIDIFVRTLSMYSSLISPTLPCHTLELYLQNYTLDNQSSYSTPYNT